MGRLLSGWGCEYSPCLSFFNPRAAAIGIGRTVGTIRTTSPIGIVDGVLGEWRAVAAVGVTRRVSVVEIGTQLATIVPLLVIEPWRIGGERDLSCDRLLKGLPYGLIGLLMPSGLNGLPAPKGLAVESELYGLALSSPRYSAWTLIGMNDGGLPVGSTYGTSRAWWAFILPRRLKGFQRQGVPAHALSSSATPTAGPVADQPTLSLSCLRF